MTAAAVTEPVDPTAGELAIDDRRRLVRSIADRVGTRVSERVQAALDQGRPMGDDAEKVAASTEIQQALRAENERRVRAGLSPLGDGTHLALHDMVLAHIYGLGELEELWQAGNIEEIDANSFDDVFVTFAGGAIKRWPPIAASDDEFLELIRRVSRRMGLTEVQFDARHPKLDLQLPDGSRLFAVYGGRGTNGVAAKTYLCIRRHRFLTPTAADLVELGLWPQEVSDFVVASMAAGENLIMSGDWRSGKTTALRGVIYSAVPRYQRVVTVEAAITELGLHASGRLDNVVALYSRPAGSEGESAVSVWELMEEYTRRLNGTRIIVGEILGREVGPVLDAFTSNTLGSACTIHARSARSVIGRFEQYGLAATPPLPVEAVRWGLAEARPIIVHLAADASVEGEMRRYCTSVVEVTGLEDGRVATTELWGLDRSGRLVAQHAPSADRRDRMARHGWDWATDGWADLLTAGPT